MKHFKYFLMVLFAGVLLTACEESNEVVTYKGNVIHADTRAPFADLEVSVTDGTHINQIIHTDAAGNFAIVVRFNEINSSYYLLIGDKSCAQVKREFKGFGQAEVDLGTIEVEGPKMPTVTTAEVTSITAGSALCGGNVTDDGRTVVTARGVCWSKTEYPTVEAAPHTSNGTGLGEFQSQISNLEAGETYYVRAYATNSLGTSYGMQRTFTTTTGLPVVTTDSITQIRSASALCYANVVTNGGYKLIAKGVCWSDISSTPTIADAYTSELASTGSFSSLMINLKANTKYYVRAYAANDNGITYGECIMFTSGNGLPIVETLDPGENITETSILAVGNVIDDEGHAIEERGFVYSTLPYPTMENGEKIASGSGKGYFSATISNITPTIKAYYIRAYATNENGTGYGDQVVITPERSEYLSLKTMTYSGYTYKIKFVGSMSWYDGSKACADMVYGGYDDWFMPNDGEVNAIIEAYEKSDCVYYSDGSASLIIHGVSSIWTRVEYYSSDAYYYVMTRYSCGSATNYYCWRYEANSSCYHDSKSDIKGVFAVRKYRSEGK